MKCVRAEQLLSEQLEGPLPQRMALALAEHLRRCAACRHLIGENLAVRNDLRALAHELHRRESSVDSRAIDCWTAERQALPASPRRVGPSRLQNSAISWWTCALVPALRTGLDPAPCAAAAILFAALGFWWCAPKQAPGVSHSALPELPSRLGTLTAHTAPARKIEDRIAARPKVRLDRSIGSRPREGPDQVTDSLVQYPGSPTTWSSPDYWSSNRVSQGQSFGDLQYINPPPKPADQHWASLPDDHEARIETQVRRRDRMRDDFVEVPFVRLASASDRPVSQAVENYQREVTIVDARLAREVTLAFKATALSDLCEHLRANTGISVTAGRSVGDEKVTIFCEHVPLRMVMRQLSRPFGYTWLRSGRDGEYRYELVQDLRSQLLEEELRARDRNAALLALSQEMERYRPFLALSPNEAMARAKTAPPAERPILETLGSWGWGPIQTYFRLTPQEQAALRSGQKLTFSQEPQAGELPLAPDLSHGVLECLREVRLINHEGGYDFAPGSDGLTRISPDPPGIPLTAIPEARASVTLQIEQSELGQLSLQGTSRFTTGSHSAGGGRSRGPYASGMSPTASESENERLNAQRAYEPDLSRRVTILPTPGFTPGAGGDGEPGTLTPRASRRPATTQPGHPSGGGGSKAGGHPAGESALDQKVTSADVLEALHKATGLPIVADFYTHLYPPERVSARNERLFTVLNRLADRMRMRWRKELGSHEAGQAQSDGTWLQFRSAGYYDDRLKEVPNRLLARWASIRRQNGRLPLDLLIEIAQLSDAQLDATDMAEGAKLLFGLKEWDLARPRSGRPHWRFLAQLAASQRQEAISAGGLPFSHLTLAQQQEFLRVAVDTQADPPPSLQELSEATLRVVYTQPGGFEWPGKGRWAVLQFRPSPVQAGTREAAFQAARRLDPSVDPGQILPTELAVTMLYTCGARPDAYVSVLRTTPGVSTGYDGHPPAAGRDGSP
jgi:hypothetical protein